MRRQLIENFCCLGPKSVVIEIKVNVFKVNELLLRITDNGNAEEFKELARTYIVKKKMNWSTLAELTGISKDKLKAVNAATGEELKAFQPVRIPNNAKPIPSDLFF